MIELDEFYMRTFSNVEKYYDASKIWLINCFGPTIERPFLLQNKTVYV